MSRDRLLAAIVAARPRDPRGREAERLAVRVLARVAALDGARPASGETSRGRRRVAARAALAAAAVAAAFGGAGSGSPPASPPRSVERPGPLDLALAGDRAAASGLWSLGPRGRALCLDRAERRGEDARAALDLFGRLGGPADAGESARLAALHAEESLAPAVRRWLAASTGDSGPRALADLLRPGPSSDPAWEAPLVEALRAVARNGRPVAALEGLRAAAAEGRRLAAAEAIALGGASEVEHLLSSALRAPREVLGSPEVGSALAASSESAQQAVLRGVDRGERAAVLAAVAARLPALPERLRPRLDEPLDARWAVAGIAAVGGPAAWRVLPLAIEGPGRVPATRALRALPPEAAAVFVAEASRAGGSRAGPFLAALAEIGDPGVAPLDRLARSSSTAAGALAALGRSRSDRASAVLGLLAARPSLLRGAADALAVRVRRGDATAADELLALARDGQARVALDALASCGGAARAALESALADPRLRRAALAALERSDDPALARLAAPARSARSPKS